MYRYPNYPLPIYGYLGYSHPLSYYRSYPPVNTKMFSSSVRNFRILMEQGSFLLDKLADASFETKMMTAAQQGKQAEVAKLIRSIGLKVPVTTHYNPTGINFILSTPATSGGIGSCCSLTISMKWGH